MHCRDVKDIESIKKKTLTFHAGLGPKIHFGILTTRISDSTATLIDNIFTNHHGGSGEYLSGILPTDISDHFSYY